MTRPSRPRTTADLSDSTHQQLNMYAVAAGAAGVGMLALAQPAEAKIVYTPTHMIIGGSLQVILDLNHDGIGDFLLRNFDVYTSFGTFANMAVISYGYDSKNLVAGNRVVFHGYARDYARALRAGVSIGPTLKFPFKKYLASMGSLRRDSIKGTTQFFGRWANGGKGVKNHYLGLKFVIRGKVHYGWARFTVIVGRGFFSETLTGYAYETIPNKPIVAGKTKGPDEVVVEEASPVPSAAPTPKLPTLGLLAIGSPGLSIWRREPLGSLP